MREIIFFFLFSTLGLTCVEGLENLIKTQRIRNQKKVLKTLEDFSKKDLMNLGTELIYTRLSLTDTYLNRSSFKRELTNQESLLLAEIYPDLDQDRALDAYIKELRKTLLFIERELIEKDLKLTLGEINQEYLRFLSSVIWSLNKLKGNVVNDFHEEIVTYFSDYIFLRPNEIEELYDFYYHDKLPKFSSLKSLEDFLKDEKNDTKSLFHKYCCFSERACTLCPMNR